MPAAAVIPASIAHVSQTVNLKKIAMSSGTFLKFSTSKFLPCPSTISWLYKFIGMFARLSASSFFWRVCGLLVGLGLGLGFRLGLGLGFVLV